MMDVDVDVELAWKETTATSWFARDNHQLQSRFEVSGIFASVLLH
jgi:hypothetical protein